jgi:hypothetical protein
VCHTLHENNVTFEQLFDSVSSIHDTVASIPTINILTPTDRFSFGDFSEIYTRISHIKNASMRYLIYIHAIVNDLTKYRPLSEKYVYDTVQIFKQMSNRNLYPFVDAIPHISFFHELSLLCLGDMLNSDAVWLSGNIADYANEFKKMHNKDMHPLLVPIAIYDVKLSVANELYEERRKWINWFLLADLVPSTALKQYEHAKRIELSQARTGSPPPAQSDRYVDTVADDYNALLDRHPPYSGTEQRAPPPTHAPVTLSPSDERTQSTSDFINKQYDILKNDILPSLPNHPDCSRMQRLIIDVYTRLIATYNLTQREFDTYNNLFVYMHDVEKLIKPYNPSYIYVAGPYRGYENINTALIKIAKEHMQPTMSVHMSSPTQPYALPNASQLADSGRAQQPRAHMEHVHQTHRVPSPHERGAPQQVTRMPMPGSPEQPSSHIRHPQPHPYDTVPRVALHEKRVIPATDTEHAQLCQRMTMEFKRILQTTYIDTDSIQLTLNDIDDAINQISDILTNTPIIAYNVYVLYYKLIQQIYGVYDHINNFAKQLDTPHYKGIVDTLHKTLNEITIIVIHSNTANTLSDDDRLFTQSMRNICEIDDAISIDSVNNYVNNIGYVRTMVLRIINGMTTINDLTHTTYRSLLDDMIEICNEIIQFIKKDTIDDVYKKHYHNAFSIQKTIRETYRILNIKYYI